MRLGCSHGGWLHGAERPVLGGQSMGMHSCQHRVHSIQSSRSEGEIAFLKLGSLDILHLNL